MVLSCMELERKAFISINFCISLELENTQPKFQKSLLLSSILLECPPFNLLRPSTTQRKRTNKSIETQSTKKLNPVSTMSQDRNRLLEHLVYDQFGSAVGVSLSALVLRRIGGFSKGRFCGLGRAYEGGRWTGGAVGVGGSMEG